ncbi:MULTISPECIES: hypothetical protein [unclassified Streptomyces]|uniref:hypothetical protein n=1 Tax=unclassified Streptomyces TaxID=2593676 RepID=UPI00340016F6
MTESQAIKAEHMITGGWYQTWPEESKGWVYNYAFTIVANKAPVPFWELAFEVAEGVQAQMNPQDASGQFEIVDNGPSRFVLRTRSNEHALEPGQEIQVAIQVLFPGRAHHEVGDGELYDVTVTEVESL